MPTSGGPRGPLRPSAANSRLRALPRRRACLAAVVSAYFFCMPDMKLVRPATPERGANTPDLVFRSGVRAHSASASLLCKRLVRQAVVDLSVLPAWNKPTIISGPGGALRLGRAFAAHSCARNRENSRRGIVRMPPLRTPLHMPCRQIGTRSAAVGLGAEAQHAAGLRITVRGHISTTAPATRALGPREGVDNIAGLPDGLFARRR